MQICTYSDHKASTTVQQITTT